MNEKSFMFSHFCEIKIIPRILLFTFCLTLLNGCSIRTLDRDLVIPEDASRLNPKSTYLKAHMRNGQVYILSNWKVDTDNQSISGTGELLDFNRRPIACDAFTIPLDSVAIFETNTTHISSAVTSMAIVTGASLAMTIFCIANPKACFGSCPTFYVDNGQETLLQAEGFSSSVAPSLEATDIDALFFARPAGKELRVIMKNEALETHVVRFVDLLIALRPESGRVCVTGEGIFWEVRHLIEPSECLGPEGSCLSQLRTFDHNERTSLTDSLYLGTKETIDLKFDNLPNDKLGLVVAWRQSLLSTYLFYQTLAYMGKSAGDWYAKLESADSPALRQIRGVRQILGGIDILVQNKAGEWIKVGETGETGPLAADLRVVPLPDLGPGPHTIRLGLTKGHWRLDYAAVAVLGKQIEPIRLQPTEVRSNSGPDVDAREILCDSARTLVTLPGDIYTLVYKLPDDTCQYEYFLKSRGYYMEWIRDEWLAEENPSRVLMMFLNPEKALHELAPEYKRVEAQMEELFWSSKYAH